jgi:mono/diheme cytochrome c family protein
MEFVQWTGNTHSSLGRNVGEVTGVYGTNWVEIDAEGRPAFRSSARYDGFRAVEGWLRDLKAPRWRELAARGILPPLDEARVTRGAAIYADRCQGCHAVQPELTAPDSAGYKYWKVGVFSEEEVGTDTALIDAANARRSHLSPLLLPPFLAAFGPFSVRLDGTVSTNDYRAFFIGATVLGTFEREGLSPAEIAKYSECRSERTQTKQGYKARSLEGVVFTAPYLHNGSVATLDDLLKPAAERPRRFWVGCRDYDPARLGYTCDADDPRNFLFDTGLPTNSNRGHEGPAFGTDLAEAERAALLEYLKSLESPAAPPAPPGGLCR